MRCRPRSLRFYSCRIALAGSTRMARRAGIQQPSSAARISTADAATSVTGSAGDTWTSWDRRRRFTAADETSPITRPAPAKAVPCRSTSSKTSLDVAPIAIRTPISCVRRLTECATTAYKPTVASRSAIIHEQRPRLEDEAPRGEDLAARPSAVGRLSCVLSPASTGGGVMRMSPWVFRINLTKSIQQAYSWL